MEIKMSQRIPTTQQGGTGHKRSALLQPIKETIRALDLPALQLRKLNGILSALEMQIESGDESVTANQLLLAALTAGVQHQMSDQKGKAGVEALETFAHHETAHWLKVDAETLSSNAPGLAGTAGGIYPDRICNAGSLQFMAACDQWQAAWRVAQQLITPAMRQTTAFNNAFPDAPSLTDWAIDYLFELHNAGIQQPTYHAQRLAYVREFSVFFFRMKQPSSIWSSAAPRGKRYGR